MLSLFRKKPKNITLASTGQQFVAAPGETILQAAVRAGIRFPHSCRVGGCAACKCQLEGGKVKELTESAYVLSGDDLDNNYILACQSVPKTDVKIGLPHWDARSPNHDVRHILGQVIQHQILTHDISAVTIRLDAPLEFTAGQYANIRLLGHDAPARSYSFANTQQSAKGLELEFYVRRVDGGALSPLLTSQQVLGEAVEIEGPLGDFWLRPDDTPILAIAGGSGLAPLISLLRQGIADGCQRPVTLLFGARQQRDLYAMEEIQRLSEQWQAPFEFVPVLSHEAEESSWLGYRGLVTEAIEGRIGGDTHVYLCGPAPMIDAAIAECQKFSVRPSQIFFDKFLDSRDVAATQSAGRKMPAFA